MVTLKRLLYFLSLKLVKICAISNLLCDNFEYLRLSNKSKEMNFRKEILEKM